MLVKASIVTHKYNDDNNDNTLFSHKLQIIAYITAEL